MRAATKCQGPWLLASVAIVFAAPAFAQPDEKQHLTPPPAAPPESDREAEVDCLGEHSAADRMLQEADAALDAGETAAASRLYERIALDCPGSAAASAATRVLRGIRAGEALVTREGGYGGAVLGAAISTVAQGRDQGGAPYNGLAIGSLAGLGLAFAFSGHLDAIPPDAFGSASLTPSLIPAVGSLASPTMGVALTGALP